MMHFSCIGGYGVHGYHTRIDVLKEELAWATDKRPCVISNLKQLYY